MTSFVLATPVYIEGMTALAKTFLDRLVTLIDPHLIERDGRVCHALRMPLPNRVFLLSVCGYPGLENFDPLVLHLERFARNFHATFVGALLRPAVFSIWLRRKYPDRVQAVLDAVRNGGVELVRDGRVSQRTRDAAAAAICSDREIVETANAHWDRELRRSTRGSGPPH